MTRDEIILSFDEVVNNLVRKYNNGKLDEDLKSESMIKVIKAVDKSLNEGLTDIDIIKRRVIVWVKNHLIDLQSKVKEQQLIEDISEILVDSMDYEELVMDIETELVGTTKSVFLLLLKNLSPEEISERLNISYYMMAKHLTKIKKAILKHGE